VRPKPKTTPAGTAVAANHGASIPVSPISAAPHISLGTAALTWLIGWLAGNIAGSAVLAASGYADRAAADRPAWVAVVASFALWIPQLAALAIASRRFATGRPVADYALRFRPIDLVGVPIGVLSQLVLLRLVYWPLQSGWPDTFSNKHLEENAKDLYDTAHGGWLVMLIVVIVVGAPLVEELVYRGLLMGAARRRIDDVLALVGVAAFFALIHFRPVEYPGLFAFGLVLGACVLATDRIGMGVVTHLAFNATALALVAH
jgi:membrane protease YdiL (CAAX protease family)